MKVDLTGKTEMETVGMKFSRLTPGLDDLEVFWDGG